MEIQTQRGSMLRPKSATLYSDACNSVRNPAHPKEVSIFASKSQILFLKRHVLIHLGTYGCCTLQIWYSKCDVLSSESFQIAHTSCYLFLWRATMKRLAGKEWRHNWTGKWFLSLTFPFPVGITWKNNRLSCCVIRDKSAMHVRRLQSGCFVVTAEISAHCELRGQWRTYGELRVSGCRYLLA